MSPYDVTKKRSPGKYQFTTVVQHVIDMKQRMEKKYPLGVGLTPSCLYDLVANPWDCISTLHIKMIVVHQIIKYYDLNSREGTFNVIDLGCGYGENSTLLRRLRKSNRCFVLYTGVDIDEDKIAIAKEINHKDDFIVDDIRKIDEHGLDEKYDAVICEIPESFGLDDGIKLFVDMYNLLSDLSIGVIYFYAPQVTEKHPRVNRNDWVLSTVIQMLKDSEFKILDYFYLGCEYNDLNSDLAVEHKINHRIPNVLARSLLSAISDVPGNLAVISFIKPRSK